jgi:hypothetical protein
MLTRSDFGRTHHSRGRKIRMGLIAVAALTVAGAPAIAYAPAASAAPAATPVGCSAADLAAALAGASSGAVLDLAYGCFYKLTAWSSRSA